MKPSFLIDIKSIQVLAHTKEYLPLFEHVVDSTKGPNPSYNKRLNSFFEILKNTKPNINSNIIIDSITEDSLHQVSCLIILTRNNPFTSKEMDLVLDFIKNENNNLLIMSNHNPFEEYDNELTSKLGVTLVGGYWSGERGKYTHIKKDSFTDHRILSFISSIVTNTTCRIESDIGKPIIYLPDEMIGRWSSEGEPKVSKRIFGLVIDGKKEKNAFIKGKVVILADSGFIGDKGSIIPGFGMIEEGDNELFIKNIIDYLTG